MFDTGHVPEVSQMNLSRNGPRDRRPAVGNRKGTVFQVACGS